MQTKVEDRLSAPLVPGSCRAYLPITGISSWPFHLELLSLAVISSFATRRVLARMEHQVQGREAVNVGEWWPKRAALVSGLLISSQLGK